MLTYILKKLVVFWKQNGDAKQWERIYFLVERIVFVHEHLLAYFGAKIWLFPVVERCLYLDKVIRNSAAWRKGSLRKKVALRKTKRMMKDHGMLQQNGVVTVEVIVTSLTRISIHFQCFRILCWSRERVWMIVTQERNRSLKSRNHKKKKEDYSGIYWDAWWIAKQNMIECKVIGYLLNLRVQIRKDNQQNSGVLVVKSIVERSAQELVDSQELHQKNDKKMLKFSSAISWAHMLLASSTMITVLIYETLVKYLVWWFIIDSGTKQ